MISNASILNVEPDRSRAVIYCQASKRKAYLCLVVKHEMKGNPYWCFYVGINKAEYSILYRTEEVRTDEFSFIGIAGDMISIQAKVADIVMMEQPEYFIGTHVWGKDMPGITGADIMSQCLEVCNQVVNILERENKNVS